MSECGICAGCIGMGPCDDELGVRGNECGKCALEADHFGPCWWPGDQEDEDADAD